MTRKRNDHDLRRERDPIDESLRALKSQRSEADKADAATCAKLDADIAALEKQLADIDHFLAQSP